MGAVPKRKVSKGRRDRRRAHDALRRLSLVLCQQCRQPKLPHHVCPSCGYYRGREIVDMSQD